MIFVKLPSLAFYEMAGAVVVLEVAPDKLLNFLPPRWPPLECYEMAGAAVVFGGWL